MTSRTLATPLAQLANVYTPTFNPVQLSGTIKGPIRTIKPNTRKLLESTTVLNRVKAKQDLSIAESLFN